MNSKVKFQVRSSMAAERFGAYLSASGARAAQGGRPSMQSNAVVETSPNMVWRPARLTGAMYIPYLAFGMPLFLRAPLIVPSDAAATAAKILASETLYRITVITDLVSYVLYIALAFLFYVLLREVNCPWAALAMLFTLAGFI